MAVELQIGQILVKHHIILSACTYHICLQENIRYIIYYYDLFTRLYNISLVPHDVPLSKNMALLCYGRGSLLLYLKFHGAILIINTLLANKRLSSLNIIGTIIT